MFRSSHEHTKCFSFTENKAKKDLIQLLVRRGYDSDPVKAWKEAQNKGKVGIIWLWKIFYFFFKFIISFEIRMSSLSTTYNKFSVWCRWPLQESSWLINIFRERIVIKREGESWILNKRDRYKYLHLYDISLITSNFIKSAPILKLSLIFIPNFCHTCLRKN